MILPTFDPLDALTYMMQAGSFGNALDSGLYRRFLALYFADRSALWHRAYNAGFEAAADFASRGWDADALQEAANNAD